MSKQEIKTPDFVFHCPFCDTESYTSMTDWNNCELYVVNCPCCGLQISETDLIRFDGNSKLREADIYKKGD